MKAQPNQQAENSCAQSPDKCATQSKPSKSFWERTAEDPVAFYTMVLTIFTGALAIVSFVQIGFLTKADNTARKSADAADRSSKAALQASLAASRQADAAEQALTGLERPIVFHIDIAPDVQMANPPVFPEHAPACIPKVSHRYANYGRTPAVCEKQWIGVELVSGGIPAEPSYDSCATGWLGIVIKAGDTSEMYLAELDRFLIAAEYRSLVGEETKFIFFGKLQYRDAHNVGYIIGFGYVYSPRADRMIAIQGGKYNYTQRQQQSAHAKPILTAHR